MNSCIRSQAPCFPSCFLLAKEKANPHTNRRGRKSTCWFDVGSAFFDQERYAFGMSVFFIPENSHDQILQTQIAAEDPWNSADWLNENSMDSTTTRFSVGRSFASFPWPTGRVGTIIISKKRNGRHSRFLRSITPRKGNIQRWGMCTFGDSSPKILIQNFYPEFTRGSREAREVYPRRIRRAKN